MSQVPSKANAALAPTSAYIGSAVKSTATSLNLNPSRSVPEVMSSDDKRKWEDFVGELEKSWKSAEAKRKAEREAAKAAPKPDGNAWMKVAHEKTASVLRAIGLKKSAPTPPATATPSPSSSSSSPGSTPQPIAGSSAQTSTSPQKQ